MQSRRTVFITGTSSGFGRGAAQALAARGHFVFATMRGVIGKNANTAAELTAWAASERHALEVLELDVTDTESVRSAVAHAAQRGPIDTLINNAGVGTWGPQEGFSPGQVLGMLDVNVVGPLRLNRAVAPVMRAAGGGHIIYVSSGLGRIQLPFLGPYTASKHAVEAIAGTGAIEMAPMGIETTVLQPGAYGTRFLQNSVGAAHPEVLDDQPPVKAFFEAFAGNFERRVAAGDVGDPQEVIDALVELVEAPIGQRPLRRCVGEDVQHGVNAINQACAQVQGHLANAFGWG